MTTRAQKSAIAPKVLSCSVLLTEDQSIRMRAKCAALNVSMGAYMRRIVCADLGIVDDAATKTQKP